MQLLPLHAGKTLAAAELILVIVFVDQCDIAEANGGGGATRRGGVTVCWKRMSL